MKIQLASDLHAAHWGSSFGFGWWQEHLRQMRAASDADVLVLAGDAFSFALRDIKWTEARLQELGAMWKHVVYIPGNHEFYGSDLDDGNKRFFDMAGKIAGVHFLGTWSPLGNEVVIDGQRFLGGTMWFPRSKTGQKISDFYTIGGFEPLVYNFHRDFKRHLTKELTSQDVVVTHHTPSEQSIPAEFAGDPCNPYFCVPTMEKLIVERQPKAWFHGHTHQFFDYHIGATRVACNPLGYVGERVRFDYGFTVEV